jgi:hypothetical protein
LSVSWEADTVRDVKVHEFEAVVGGEEGRLPLVELPFDVKEAYGAARPKVRATVNDVTLRTTVSVYGGRSYVGFRKEIQEAAGIRIGDRIRVRIEPDLEPREIEVPEDLARALGNDRAASQTFDRLSYTHRKEYGQWVVGAKRPETRQRRVEKAIELLRAGTQTAIARRAIPEVRGPTTPIGASCGGAVACRRWKRPCRPVRAQKGPGNFLPLATIEACVRPEHRSRRP